jgi:hypothetical protein
MGDSKLFQKFLGKNVNVIMKSVKGSQQLGDGSIVEGNVVMTGFLLDEDDDFFYLGTTDEQIDEALKKTDIVRIFLDNENVLEFDETDTGDRH